MAAWCTVSGVCVQGEDSRVRTEDEWQRGVQ